MRKLITSLYLLNDVAPCNPSTGLSPETRFSHLQKLASYPNHFSPENVQYRFHSERKALLTVTNKEVCSVSFLQNRADTISDPAQCNDGKYIHRAPVAVIQLTDRIRKTDT